MAQLHAGQGEAPTPTFESSVRPAEPSGLKRSNAGCSRVRRAGSSRDRRLSIPEVISEAMQSDESDQEEGQGHSIASSVSGPSRHSSVTSVCTEDYEANHRKTVAQTVPSIEVIAVSPTGLELEIPREDPDSETIKSIGSSSRSESTSVETVVEAVDETPQPSSHIQPQSDYQSEADVNQPRWKGKGKLMCIRDLDWASIRQADVRSVCASYDKHPSWLREQHKHEGKVVSPGAPQSDVSDARNRTTRKHIHLSPRPLAIDNVVESKAIKKSIPVTHNKKNAGEDRDALMKRLRQYETTETQERIASWSQQLRTLDKAMSKRLDDLDHAVQERKLQLDQERALKAHYDALDRQRALMLARQLDAQEAEARRQAEKRARMKECSVCGDVMDKDLFPQNNTTKKCMHEGMICSNCLDSWIASALNDHGIDGIKCPECPEKLTYNDVQAVAGKSTFEKYDKATITQALSSLPDFAWCLNAECKSGQLNIDNSNYMDCVSCKYRQCLHHKVPWHSGETCAQYDHRTSGAKAREEEAKTLAMLDTMSKLCPGPNCGWRIQKVDGCDHVTCRKCQFQFCWQCLASHLEIKKVGNTAHHKDCKFHSANLELAWPFNRH